MPGIAEPVPVGLGLAFDQTGGQWHVRSAQPGAVTVGGFFEQNGTIDPDVDVSAFALGLLYTIFSQPRGLRGPLDLRYTAVMTSETQSFDTVAVGRKGEVIRG